MSSAPTTGAPALEIHVLRGEPTDVELAALVAVLAGLAGTTAAQQSMADRAWVDPARRPRTSLRPGPGAWRASLRDHWVW